MAVKTTLVKEIHLRCPECNAEQALAFPSELVDQSKRLTTVLVRGACGHKFHAFIDKDFNVRGYQASDIILPARFVEMPKLGVFPDQEQIMESDSPDPDETYSIDMLKKQYRERKKNLDDMIFSLEVKHLEFEISDDEFATKKAKLVALQAKFESEFQRMVSL
ncbi:MAG: hypothetical protein ACTSUE_26660 [Promethearchaeota archaeon]